MSGPTGLTDQQVKILELMLPYQDAELLLVSINLLADLAGKTIHSTRQTVMSLHRRGAVTREYGRAHPHRTNVAYFYALTEHGIRLVDQEQRTRKEIA